MKICILPHQDQEVTMNPARIGVVICSCGTQLSEKIDLGKLKEVAKGLEDVVKVLRTEKLCGREGISSFKSEFAGCDRILFAGCSERSSLTFDEEKIATILEEMGINRAMFEVANLREQCIWIHDEEVTGKAIDMLKMAHAKLLTNRPSGKAEIVPKILIVGGGVAGMQAAAQAAENCKVTLVERNPYLGGHTCQIPTLFQCEGWPSFCTSECVIPVLAREVTRKSVKLYTNSKVLDVRKENGNFIARIEKAPAYVDPEKCTSCGKCSEVCPIEIENSYDLGFSKRKAIDKEFYLAIPDAYTIVEGCTKCGECLKVCPTKAINLEAEKETFEDTFGSVIISTGFRSFDLRRLEELSYAHPRVVSSMEMERLLAKGLRINGKRPERVAFILCGGSRDKGVPYCSKTCCATAVKQASRAMSLAPESEVSMIYSDMRTYERAFERFYREAQELVDFISGEVKGVKEAKGALKVKVGTKEGEEELEADLVVLAEALLPEGVELLEKLKVNTDKFGYPIEFQPRILNPTQSQVKRVYLAGSVSGPKIVQEAVEQGVVTAKKATEAVEKKRLCQSSYRA